MNNLVFHTEVCFSGRVQGVGFRYCAWQVAREFEVSGYVANLSDGRVLIEAEGVETEVTGFKDEVENRLQPFIRKVEAKTQRRPPRFAGFTIK